MVAAVLALIWTLVAIFLGVSYENHQNRRQDEAVQPSETSI